MGIVLSFVLGFSYLYIIANYLKNWRNLKFVPGRNNLDNIPFMSVVVAARDEEKNVSLCIQSLLNQDYPLDKYEIIIVDDFSTDKTAELIKKFETSVTNLKYLSSNANEQGHIISYKREALQTGINASKGEYILLTDADCTVPTSWITTYSEQFIKEDSVFIGGPVIISDENQNLLTSFQGLDMIGMMVITGAGYQSGNQLLANGANMGFSKQVFNALGGYDHFPKKASGDDMFLLHHFHQHHPKNIRFLKTLSAVVVTQPEYSIKSLLRQRIRWASKNNAYKEMNINFSLSVLFIVSLTIVILGVLSIIQASIFFPMFCLLYIFKIFSDYLLQREAIRFFNKRKLKNYFFLSQSIHTLYIAWVGIMAGLFPVYRWKGRKVR
ncbi:MAG: glycosyltransferase [Saprospiraceae bacterium]|nr:glycosyltransferase [Saprospiraceae bacterium]